MTRRAGLVAVAAALLLAACGAPAPHIPAVPLGNLDAPIAVAPLLLDQGDPPTLLADGGAKGQAAPLLIAPSTDLLRLTRQGFTVVGAICRTSPETLLWHGGGLFSWQDFGKAPLYLAPGADARSLEIAVARYRGILDKLPQVVPAAGGVQAFRTDRAGFLLAPEPLASLLVAKGEAHLAQPLADELGPYPTCLVYARTSVVRRDPLLVTALLRRIDLGLWQLRAQTERRELPLLRALAPTIPPSAILRALAAARSEGIFRQTVLLGDLDLRALHDEIAPGAWPDSALDLGPARAALRRPFVP